MVWQLVTAVVCVGKSIGEPGGREKGQRRSDWLGSVCGKLSWDYGNKPHFPLLSRDSGTEDGWEEWEGVVGLGIGWDGESGDYGLD
jgi:hypothetical protein